MASVNQPGAHETPPHQGRDRVTVCIIAYNYAHFLRECIESALEQDELASIIVIDDGSTDNTESVAREFEGRVAYVSKANGGLSEARNYGVERCSTRYVVFLDADNMLGPGFVRLCADALDADPRASFAYTQLELFGLESGRTCFPAYSVARLRRGNYIDAEALLRTSVVRQYPYDTRLRHGFEDWDFFLALAEHGHQGILVPGTHICYRKHGHSMGDHIQRDRWVRRRAYARIMWTHRRLIGLDGMGGFVARSGKARLKALRR